LGKVTGRSEAMTGKRDHEKGKRGFVFKKKNGGSL